MIGLLIKILYAAGHYHRAHLLRGSGLRFLRRLRRDEEDELEGYLRRRGEGFLRDRYFERLRLRYRTGVAEEDEDSDDELYDEDAYLLFLSYSPFYF